MSIMKSNVVEHKGFCAMCVVYEALLCEEKSADNISMRSVVSASE